MDFPFARLDYRFWYIFLEDWEVLESWRSLFSPKDVALDLDPAVKNILYFSMIIVKISQYIQHYPTTEV